jgi:NitT/TauT family transport system permease protein
LNDLAVIFITTLGATWTMCLSARTGIKNIPPIYLKAAMTMGTANWPMFTQVMVPASFPHLINGLRVAWAFAWRALVAGELIARGAGLGHRMEDAKSVGAVETMLAVVLIIAVLGTLSDHLLFKRLEDRLLTRYGLKK